MNQAQSYNYGDIVKLKEKQLLQFPDFKLVYQYEEDPEANSEIKSSANVLIKHFLATDKDGEHEFQVIYSQLPPDNVELKLSSGIYVIHAFLSPKKIHLYPDNIVILKK